MSRLQKVLFGMLGFIGISALSIGIVKANFLDDVARYAGEGVALNINNNLGADSITSKNFQKNIISVASPVANNTYDLGEYGNAWRNIMASGTVRAESFVGDGSSLTGVSSASSTAQELWNYLGVGRTATTTITGNTLSSGITTSYNLGKFYVDSSGNVNASGTMNFPYGFTEPLRVGNGSSTTTVNGSSTSTFPYGATFATTGGNVGIGTVSPTTKFDITTAQTSGYVMSINASNLASEAGLVITVPEVGGSPFRFRRASDNATMLDIGFSGSGGTDINNTSGKMRLYGLNSAGGITLRTKTTIGSTDNAATDIPLSIIADASQSANILNITKSVAGDVLAITGAGNVGIGTSGPSERLTVGGNTSAIGNIALGDGTTTSTLGFATSTYLWGHPLSDTAGYSAFTLNTTSTLTAADVFTVRNNGTAVFIAPTSTVGASKATCWLSDGASIGYCSDTVGATGGCTCNPK